MPEELSSVAQWARINRLDAKDRAVLAKDKYRFIAYCIEDVAVDIQAVADELQLSKTAVVSRLVALAAREACIALDLDRPAPVSHLSDEEYQEIMEMQDNGPSPREVARARLAHSIGVVEEEVPA